VFGNVSFAERYEQLAYNALPAALTPDQWAHVYLQQDNQVNSMHCDPNIYVSDGPDSNIFGLEPNYGCCTVNFPQGWPKFVSNLYFKTPDNGILVAAYGPSVVNTQFPNQKLQIRLDTNYPFGETLTFTVTASAAFPFYLRIPSWSVNPTLKVGSGSATPVPPGQIYRANLPQGTTTVTAQFPMAVRVEKRFNNGVSVYRGPLLYALKIGTQETSTKHYAFNSYDWLIKATTPWNYALVINNANPSSSFTFVQGTLGPLPFSPNGAPVSINANAKILDSWQLTTNAAAAPPVSPVTSSHPTQQIQLIPFGSTNLRVAEFPFINA
jgi:DUF1680 family protein